VNQEHALAAVIISSRGEWPNIYLDPFLSLALIAKAAPVRASLQDLAPGRMIARRRTHKTARRGAEEIITNSVQIARNCQARPSCEGWRLSPIAVVRLLVDPASDGNAEPMRLVRVRGL
jgi:hypothetical protein